MMKFFFLFFNAKLSKCTLYEMSKLSKYSSQTFNSNSSFVIFFCRERKIKNWKTAKLNQTIFEKDRRHFRICWGKTLTQNYITLFSDSTYPSCKTFINMTKSKSNTKAADKKKERIELQKRIDARIKFVSEANKQEDPLSILPSFKVWMLKISWNYCILLLTDFFWYHT